MMTGNDNDYENGDDDDEWVLMTIFALNLIVAADKKLALDFST